MLEVSKKIQINPDIILRGINSKYWALNTRSGAQYRLNELSFDVLSAADGKTSIEDIIEDQMKKYNVKRTVLENDIMMFLSNAMQKGIILE